MHNVYDGARAGLGVIAALSLVGAALLYGYSLTMDVSTTDSNQNLVQFWAGLLLSLTVVLGALFALLVGLAVMAGESGSSRRTK